MAFNYKGGKLQLTATFQRINSSTNLTHYLNVRSALSNGTVWLSADGVTECGFLQAGEARQFIGTPPAGVYAKGTAGDGLYWDVNE